MKKMWCLLALLLPVTMVVAGCGFSSENNNSGGEGGGTSESSSGPIKVGYIGPFTGEYAGFGEDHLQALELAVEQWNEKGGLLGRELEVDSGDSQGEAKQAAALAHRFVDEGVKIVVGPTLTTEAQTAIPIFCSDGITAITGLADLLQPQGNPCYFRTSLREDQAGEFGGRLIAEYFHAKTVAIINDGEADTVTTSEYAEKALGEEVKVVYSGSITPGEQDYSATLTKVKEENPEVVFLATTNPTSAILRKQGAQLGLESEWLLAAGSVNPEFKKIAGSEGVTSYSYDAAREEARFKEFAKAYEKKFGEEPENYNEYAYDAANVLFTAVEKAGTLESPKVQSAVRATKNFPGTTGPISFDSTGGRGSELYEIEKYGPSEEWEVIKNPPFDTP
jgi:branched-chain amino acid transport system substrate-binding protein